MSEDEEPMTIGQLAARTGLPIKAIRDLEWRGLICTPDRSHRNYRLSDSSALRSSEAIVSLRSLGMTIKQIEQLVSLYLDHSASLGSSNQWNSLHGAAPISPGSWA